MRRRWRLFPKYALLIATVVGAMLVASGVIGVYFSWRETEAQLVALQHEKAAARRRASSSTSSTSSTRSLDRAAARPAPTAMRSSSAASST